MLGSKGLGGDLGYTYGALDYEGDIWDIDEKDSSFDAVLCTEVLEHVPYPIETLEELARLLKPGGTLILTAPSNCLRHMDPYFFSSGYSDRFYDFHLDRIGLEIISMDPVGHYYRWISVEILRTIREHKFFGFLLIPALIFYSSKKTSEKAVDTLCMGYHITARKSA
jgi:SAM-dependent methyltransferase